MQSEKVKISEMAKICETSKPTVYAWERTRADFPKRVIVGPRVSYWRRKDVMDFIKSVTGDSNA